MTAVPGDITRLLQLIAGGDQVAVGVLWTRVHGEIRRMASAALAREHGPTLEPTALVNEVWLRLHGSVVASDPESNQLVFRNRAHFFGAVARTLGRLLIDRGRARRAAKRGSGMRPVSFGGATIDLVDGGLADVDDDRTETLERLIEAIDVLDSVNVRAAEVVRLRFIAGLDVPIIAEILGIAPRTVYDDWLWARVWLRRRVGGA